MLAHMERHGEKASDEMALFLDGGELYVTGSSEAIDALIVVLVGPEGADRRRSLTSDLTALAAVGATLAAVTTTSEELLRLSPASAKKLAKYGAQLTEGGSLRGYVKAAGGEFAGDLSFDSVSLGAQQALAMQTAAVSLALRSAIADVQTIVEVVDRKVSDIQKKLRAREVGEVVGTFRHLQRIVDSTRARGRLLDADWDQVSGAGMNLGVALESLRVYVRDSINDLDDEVSVAERAAAFERFANPKGAAACLQLILVAEQALYLFEYLRLERVRATDPAHVASAIADARRTLTDERERDAALVRTAAERIELVNRVGPFEIHRLLAIPRLADASAAAKEALASFAAASRSELPDMGEGTRRPAFSETRKEAKRQATIARAGVVDVSRMVGGAASQNAKKTSSAALKKVRKRSASKLTTETEAAGPKAPNTISKRHGDDNG